MILASLRNKKLYKAVTIATSLVFIGSIVIAALLSSAQASAAAPDLKLGIVERDKVARSIPDYQIFIDNMNVEQANIKKDFDSNSAKMSDNEKQAYAQQLQQRLQEKQQTALKAMFDKINAAIKDVAEKKGLSAVMEKTIVYYGGTDITDDVIKKMTGK